MRHSLKLLAATVFLVSSPVEAVFTDNSSVAKSVINEEVAMLTTMKTNPEPIHWAAFTLIGEAE